MIQQRNTIQETTNEIDLFTIFRFFSNHLKVIVGTTLIGISVAGLFFMVAPKQFEATALIEMAQISNHRNMGNVTNPNNQEIVIPVESPALLAERLKRPSTYSSDVIKSCAAANAPSSPESVAKMVRTSQPKTLPTILEISVRGENLALVKQCSDDVIELIRSQQAKLIEPYQAEWRDTLKDYKSRLREDQDLLAKLEKQGLFRLVYLSKLDETMFLIQQISELERYLEKDKRSRLISPVYVSPEAVYPKLAQTLIFGAIAGLIIGLLGAFWREAYVQWIIPKRERKENQDTTISSL